MKKIIALLFLAGVSHAGTMTTFFTSTAPDTIVVDSATIAPTPSGASSPISWTHLVGSGTRRLMMVGCATAFDVGTLSVTVGGNAMTKSTSTAEGTPYQTYIFYYPSPASGSQTIEVSWTSGGSDSRVLCGAVSYAGVSQSSPVEVSTGTYSGNGSITSTLTTLTANDALFGVLNDNGGSSQSGVPTAGQNVIKFMPGSSNGFGLYISSRAATTAGSYSDSWTSHGGPVQESYIGIKRGP